MTTTAVALANAWPDTKPAVVVEADPAGGRLAQLADADPHRGLASLAAATTQSPGDSPVSTQLWEHVQTLGSGVPFLAAPPSADAMAATLTAPVSMPAAVPRLAELVVIADCGLADPASPATPIAAGADVLIVVVRGERAAPQPPRPRGRAVAPGGGRGGGGGVGGGRTGGFGGEKGV
ncbi:MinD/ParA family ATP-binding protein, partial [Nocardia cyriacigeorgica]|uniref:MinD/ParA family ATP-binding protein n=1 Tax=Nocardia cyriacigeorgica TaxID=135487 RepID=UPI003CC80901